MALEPKRHCPRPGHPAFFGRRCPKCEKERNDSRGSASSRGYGVKWRIFRLEFIKNHPFCNEEGCKEPTVDVHHTKPLSEGGKLLDENNCEPKCHRHHSKITGRDQVKVNRK